MLQTNTNIALVIPPRQNDDCISPIDPPIGIMSIAAYLESKGVSIILIDSIVERTSPDKIIQTLRDNKIDVVGISCNYCTYHDSTIALSKKIKAEVDNITILVGGNHATSLSAELLIQSHGSIDCVVRGEGEITMYDFVKNYHNKQNWAKIDGLCYFDDGKLVTTQNRKLIENLNDLPPPAYHLLPMNLYSRYNIVSSRGCPYGCDFCASAAIFSNRVRYRNPEVVLKEIRELIEKYGNKKIWFSDDTFTFNKNHTRDILEGLVNTEMGIKWSCLTTAHNTNRELLEKMKMSGCQYVSYGVESGNSDILRKFVGKPIDRDGIIELSKLTCKVGLDHYGLFIVGFPGESQSTLNDTYDLIAKSEFSGGGVNILIPLPGTRLWKLLFTQQKLFRLEEVNWNNFFARGEENQHSRQSAELASRWCSLSTNEIIEACNLGQRKLLSHTHNLLK
jgi:radical SAM superfamily enzyme YgiQ (UPF0313 family)